MQLVKHLLRIGLSLVLSATASPLLAANLSPEQALPLHDQRDAYEPAAAHGQEGFLVAWKSGQLGPGDLRKEHKYIGDIVAVRLDKAGKPMDPEPIIVSGADDLQEHPRIAFGKGIYLVVWHDFRNGKDWDIYAARVQPDGKVLDPNGIPVCTAPHSQALPDVTWDGKTFLVVWQDFRSDIRYEIYGARVSAEGKVLEVNGMLYLNQDGDFLNAPLSRWSPLVASGEQAGKSLVFWRGTSNHRGVPIAGTHWIQDGAVGAKSAYETADVRNSPGGGTTSGFPMCLASGKGGFIGAWTTDSALGRGQAANDAHGAIFSAEGVLQQKFKLNNEGEGRIRDPSAVWSGTNYLVAWDQQEKEGTKKMGFPVEIIHAAEVSTDGTVTGVIAIAGSEQRPAINPAVTSDGAGLSLIVYEQHPDTGATPICIGYRLLSTK